MYEIYVITNKVNNKIYVGQVIESKGYVKRFKEHVQKAFQNKGKKQPALHAAIIKYGSDNFTVKRILKRIPEDRVDFYERLWIGKLGSYYRTGHGYNMTLGGKGTTGHPCYVESLHRQSEGSKKWWAKLREDPRAYEEFCSKRAMNTPVYVRSPQLRAKLSEGARERFKHRSGTMLGKKHTLEARRKISEARTKYPVSAIDPVTGITVKTFASQIEATNWLLQNGFTTNKTAYTRISKICHGQDKTAYGFIWKFI